MLHFTRPAPRLIDVAAQLQTAAKLSPEQQARVTAVAAELTNALDGRLIAGEELRELGVPRELLPHVVFEMFLARYPTLRAMDAHANSAALAKAITDAPRLSPGGAALAAFDEALALPPRRYFKDFELLSSKISVTPAAPGEEGRVSLQTIGYSAVEVIDRGQQIVVYADGSRQNDTLPCEFALHNVSEAGLLNIIGVIERAGVLPELERVAREGGQPSVSVTYLQHTLLPRLRAAVPSAARAALQQHVKESLHGIVGVSVGRVTADFLYKLATTLGLPVRIGPPDPT